jgi:hypothetical protein
MELLHPDCTEEFGPGFPTIRLNDGVPVNCVCSIGETCDGERSRSAEEVPFSFDRRTNQKIARNTSDRAIKPPIALPIMAPILFLLGGEGGAGGEEG